MAKILNGILGGISGKVSGVVGAKWKSIDYIRAYVKPANPNTASQQVQRTKFADVVNFCKALVGQVFNTYTDKFQKSMSGFNFFIKRNIDIFDGTPAYDEILLTEGPLSQPLIGSPTISVNTLTVPFTKNLGNNGLDTNGVFACCYNKETGVWFFASDEVDRSTETIDITTVGTPEGIDLEVWIWAREDTSNILTSISNSSQSIAAAA